MPKSTAIESVEVDDAVKSVFRQTDWMQKTGIGGMLAALSIVIGLFNVLLIPLMVACWALIVGYVLRVIRLKARDSHAKLPDWNDWGDLFLSGITWIAYQTMLWGFILLLVAVNFSFCTLSAATAATEPLTILWCLAGSLLPALTVATLAYVVSYVMVNFAIEENARAGLAYLKVMKRISRHPIHYCSGFILAFGIQWLAVVLPLVTVVGVFLIPQTWFIGQIAAAAVLARYWGADVEAGIGASFDQPTK